MSIAANQITLPEIIPISKPTLDLDVILTATNYGIRGMTDQSPVKFSKPATYLIYLQQLVGTRRCCPENILRHLSPEVLRSLHYGFLFKADKETSSEFRASARVVTSNVRDRDDCITLGTGPLLDWYETILSNSTEDRSFFHRFIVNALQLYFQRFEGLALIFDGQRKVTLPDQTFYLEDK